MKKLVLGLLVVMVVSSCGSNKRVSEEDVKCDGFKTYYSGCWCTVEGRTFMISGNKDMCLDWGVNNNEEKKIKELSVVSVNGLVGTVVHIYSNKKVVEIEFSAGPVETVNIKDIDKVLYEY